MKLRDDTTMCREQLLRSGLLAAVVLKVSTSGFHPVGLGSIPSCRSNQEFVAKKLVTLKNIIYPLEDYDEESMQMRRVRVEVSLNVAITDISGDS